MKVKKEKEPKYIIDEIYYGEKKLIDCMKNIIRQKLKES